MTVFVLWIFLISIEVNAKYFLAKKSGNEKNVVKNHQTNEMNDYNNDAYRESDESNYYIPEDVEYYLILTF